MKRRVWIGAAGSNAAFAFASAIDQHWSHSVEIVLGDTNDARLVAASTFSKTFHRMPPARDARFFETLTSRLMSERIHSYLPTHDEELVFVANRAEDLRKATGVYLAIADSDTIRICHDKLELGRLLRAKGLPSPLSISASESEWTGKPVFAKPRFGCGSIGARPVLSLPDWERVRSDAEELVLQEVCQAPEVTIDLFSDRRTGNFRSACRERLAVKAGVCIKARLHHDAQLHDLAVAVAKAVGISGSFCLQVMRTSRGDWTITDVNPRIGAGTSMSLAGGMDFAAAHLAHHWGENALPYVPQLIGERYVVRHYQHIAFNPDGSLCS